MHNINLLLLLRLILVASTFLQITNETQDRLLQRALRTIFCKKILSQPCTSSCIVRLLFLEGLPNYEFPIELVQ